jgi:hypothetical protein
MANGMRERLEAELKEQLGEELEENLCQQLKEQFKNEPQHALSVIAVRRTRVYPEPGYPISKFWITRPQTFEASGVC